MGDQKRILIAEDDLTASRLLKLALERAGYEVLAAMDGMQAVQIAHREHLDLAILDINMPAQDGTRVAENLSLSPETFSIPIMFLSSNSREEAAKHGDISMARAYLQKPVKVDQLLDQVRQVI